jgi:hypothetical protein
MIARPSWFDTMLGRTSSAHVRSETGELGDHIAECPGHAFAPVDPIPTRGNASAMSRIGERCVRKIVASQIAVQYRSHVIVPWTRMIDDVGPGAV